MGEKTAGAALPPEAGRYIDEQCHRFEAAWKAAGDSGPPPRLEEFLPLSAGDRGPLLEELIALDLHYRRRRGEQPRPDEYQGRFPDLEAGHLSDAFFYPPPGDAPPTSAEVAAQLRRFRPQRDLGRGRNHVVFLADDPDGRPLVLKVVRGDADQRRQWSDRVSIAAPLTHPSLLPVLESGESGELFFVATPFCPGPPLDDWLRANPRPPLPLVAGLIASLAGALHILHQKGIAHRKLTPANVLLAPRSADDPALLPAEMPFVPKLTDCGLTAVQEDADTSSPFAADLRDLGALCYELLTGHSSATGASPSPREMRATLPRPLEVVCLKCLRDGYGSAREVADDLQRFLSGGTRWWVWGLVGLGLAAAGLYLTLRGS